MLISLSQAQDAAASGASGSLLFQLFFLSSIFAIFYFLLIRPQRQRQREHEMMVNTIDKGTELVTSGGLVGQVTAVEGDYLRLRVATDTELLLQRQSVHAVLPKGTLKSLPLSCFQARRA